MWHESDADRELATLKRQKLNLDSLLANEQSKTIQLGNELKEIKVAHREDVHRMQQEMERGVRAEESLRRKTEEYKLCEVQKANSETALLTAQRLLKEEASEVKRLNYELEVGSSRFSGTGAAQTRLVAEKAALEQRCEQLVEELSKSESALERERANGSTSAFGGQDRQKTSNLNAQVIDLENRLTALQSENSRLTTKSSRTSIAPADPAPSRNRFGYAPRPSTADLPAPTPARPSQLPLHSSRRRSSSFSGLPGTTIEASRVVQLEREVADARSRSEWTEKELSGLRTKLTGKERELLKVENELMALERESSEAGERMKGKLGDAFEELESSRSEVGRVRDVTRGECERLVKDGAERRGELEARIGRMESALEKKEEEVERAEERREEVERELRAAKEEDRTARIKGMKAVEELLEEKVEVERILAGVRQELKVEVGKEGVRERMEEELVGTKSALEELRTKLSRAIEGMSEEKARVERELERAVVELKKETGRVESAEMEVEKAEERVAQAEEARVKAEKAVREGLKPVDDGRWEVEIASLKEKLEKDGEELRSSKADYAILQNEMDALRTQHASVDESIIQLRAGLATKEAAANHLTSQLATTTSSHSLELAAAVDSLAQAEAAKEALEKERTSLLSLLETAEESIAKLQEEQQGATTALVTTAELEKERDDLLDAVRIAGEKLVAVDGERTSAVAAKEAIEQERDALVLALGSAEEKAVVLEDERAGVAETLAAKRLVEQQHESLCIELQSTITLLETERDDVATSLGSLSERSSALASERNDLAELVKTYEERIQALESSLVDLAAATAALDVLRTEKADAERVAAECEEELVVLDGALQESEAKVVTLKTSLAAAASRSFDDAQVEKLRNALAESEQVVEDLRNRIEEVESLEWGAAEGRKLAETEVDALRTKVAELQVAIEDLVDSSRGEALKAQSELSASRQAAEEAESRVALLEDRLAETTQAHGELEQQVKDLGASVSAFEPTLARLAILEDDLRVMTAELESLRQTAEDSSIAALQESGAFQGRIAEQEMEIQQLAKEVNIVEELRSNLAIAEARVQTLDWELLEAQNQTASSSRESTRHLAALTTRAENAEEDVHRLQSELESATARVVALESTLAQLRTSDSRPSSAPGSPSATDAHASRQAEVLVSRLREERDELRSRLQFTRTEAQFRYEALQEQVHDVEEEKAREVSDLQVRLAQHSESIAAKDEVQGRSVVALGESREDVLRLTTDVEEARQALVSAESRIAEFETMAEDSAALSREYDVVLAQVDELEDRLATTSADAELIRSQLAIVRIDNEELHATLTDLELQLDQSSEESSRQRQLASEASAALELTKEQCRLAEVALAEAEKDLVDQASTLSAPVDLSPHQSLVDDLQYQVSELEAKVLRRTEQIGHHEQTIAILTIQLAAAAPLDDDDDTAEIEQPAAIRADVEAELASRSARLETEIELRRNLESELHVITASLEDAQEQLSSAASDIASLQAQLDQSSQSEGSALANAQAALEDAESRRATLQGEHDALLVAIDELKASQDDETRQQSSEIERLVAEVELSQSLYRDAVDKVASLEMEIQEESLERATASESSTANLESAAQREANLADRLAAAASDLVDAQDKAASLQSSLEDAESRIDPLESEISSLQQQVAERSAALAASLLDVSTLQASYAQLSIQFDGLATSQADLAESHATEVARLSSEVERLAEEQGARNAKFVRLENELAEKEAHAAELESMYEDVKASLDDSELALSDLSTRPGTSEHDVFEARQAAGTIVASLAELQAQATEGLEIRDRLEAKLQVVDSLYQTASADLDQAASANEGSAQRIVELEEHLGRLESELAEAKEVLDTSEQALREEVEELGSLTVCLQDDKERLVVELAASRDQLVVLQVQAANSEQTRAQVEEIEQLLEQSRQEAAKLEETLQSERAAAMKAKAAAEELSSREIQTLRRLARTSDAEVEALKQDRRALESLLQESEGLAGGLQQEMLRLQAEKESQVQEVLLHLESLEGEKAEADARIISLEEQLVERDAAASQASETMRSSQEAVDRVKELEKRLEEKSMEVEETDEKYIEVLRTQKRHLGQIERLKVKIESLQRDLVAVKEVAPAPPAPSVAPVAPSSAGKKRTRPAEFDPTPSAPIPPRAVVATVSRSAKAAPALTPSSLPQDENALAPRPRSPIKRRTSKKEVVKTADGFVPLKPEGVSLPTERKALAPVGANSALSTTPPASAAADKTKVAELRARLARMKGKPVVAPAGEGLS